MMMRTEGLEVIEAEHRATVLDRGDVVYVEGQVLTPWVLAHRLEVELPASGHLPSLGVVDPFVRMRFPFAPS